jgi:hypothetical protein
LTHPNGTRYASASFSDTTGSSRTYSLTLLRSSGLRTTTLSTTSSAPTSGGVLTIPLPNTTGAYLAVLRADDIGLGSAEYTLRNPPASFNAQGPFFAALLFIGIVSLGFFNPVMAVLMGILGLVVISVMPFGLVTIGASAIGFFIAVGLIIMMRGRN